MRAKIQSYEDGIVKIYSISNIAEPGEMKKEGLTLKVGPLPFEERTVGMSRILLAKQESARIDIMLRVPQIRSVNVHDVAVTHDDVQYEIKLIQYPSDVEPPSMDLSLEKLATQYEFGGAP